MTFTLRPYQQEAVDAVVAQILAVGTAEAGIIQTSKGCQAGKTIAISPLRPEILGRIMKPTNILHSAGGKS